MIPEAEHEALYRDYLAELEARWPGFGLIDKSTDRLSRVIDRALRLLTLGGQQHYMDRYVTTLGSRVYLPAGWEHEVPPGERYCILRHEAVHIAQFRRLTWPGMTLLYLFLPLPAGFAAGRAWLEWRAYQESLRATWQVYGEAAARSPALAEDIVRRFTGPDYGWMWLDGAGVRRAIGGTLEALAAELSVHPGPAAPPPSPPGSTSPTPP